MKKLIEKGAEFLAWQKKECVKVASEPGGVFEMDKRMNEIMLPSIIISHEKQAKERQEFKTLEEKRNQEMQKMPQPSFENFIIWMKQQE